MSFKSLNDRYRRNALGAFLDAADELRGILVAIAIDRQLPSMFTRNRSFDMTLPETRPFACFPPRVFERLLRIVDFVALFIAGLSGPHQDVFWFSDEDEMVANEQRIRAATELFGRVSDHYLSHMMGHFRFGSTASDDGSLTIEDLAAVPDLIAGAWAEVLSVASKEGTLPRPGLVIPLPGRLLSLKSRFIIEWLRLRGRHLCRLACMIDKGDTPTAFGVTWLDLPDLEQPPV